MLVDKPGRNPCEHPHTHACEVSDEPVLMPFPSQKQAKRAEGRLHHGSEGNRVPVSAPWAAPRGFAPCQRPILLYGLPVEYDVRPSYRVSAFRALPVRNHQYPASRRILVHEPCGLRVRPCHSGKGAGEDHDIRLQRLDLGCEPSHLGLSHKAGARLPGRIR